MMKGTATATLCCVLGSASAQTSVYHPFPDSAAMWCVYTAHNDGPCLYETRASYEYSGEELIDGVVYGRLLNAWSQYDVCAASGSEGDGLCYIRQDTVLRKVWQYVPGSGETLLYDLDLQVGDTLNEREHWGTYFPPSDPWIVTSIDSVPIGGEYRKRFNYAPASAPWCTSSMIEGIGPAHGLFAPPPLCFEYTAQLSKFYQDGVLLYGDSVPSASTCPHASTGLPGRRIRNTVSITPVPFHSTAQLTVEPDPVQAELRITNTRGECVWRQTLTSRVTTLHRNGWASGLYFYQVVSKSGQLAAGRFLIE